MPYKNFYARDPRWIDARFTGTCARCGAVITRGMRIFYYPANRATYCGHEACGGHESRAFEAAVWDEENYR